MPSPNQKLETARQTVRDQALASQTVEGGVMLFQFGEYKNKTLIPHRQSIEHNTKLKHENTTTSTRPRATCNVAGSVSTPRRVVAHNLFHTQGKKKIPT
jgi:hypothetical protein